jgi:hypothetical protein
MALRTYDEVIVVVADVDGWMSSDQARRPEEGGAP